MMTRIRKWLAPPVFANEKDSRTAYLLNIISFSYLLVLLVLTLLGVFQNGFVNIGRSTYIELANRVLPLILAFVVAQILMRRGNVRLASYAYVILLWFSYAWGIWQYGGIQASTLSNFILAVLIAGLLIGNRGAMITAGSSVFYIFLVLVLQNQGVIADWEISPIEPLISVTMNLIMSAIYLSLYIRSLDEALDTAEAANEQFAEAQNTLEIRVSERTQDLKLAAEIGRNVSQIRDLSELTTTAVSLIQQRFALYHVQLYLADAEQTTLTLLASTGEAGKQMLAAGHALTINTTSINSRAASQKQPVIVADTATSENFMPHPLLPDTRSETAVPLLVGNNVVGVLDLQSSEPNTFTEESLPAFVTLAGQLAIAIDNSTLFTEQERLTTELQRNAAFLDTIFDSLPLMLFVKDAQDLRFVRYNQAGADMIGIPVAEMLGKSDYDFFPKEEADFFTSKDREVLANGVIIDILEESIQTVHKGSRLLHTTKIPILDANGEARYLLGIAEDITERKAAETDLVKFKLGMERSADAIFMTDVNGTITYVNEAFVEIYGYTKEEALGNTPRIIKSGLTNQAGYEYFWQTLLSGGVVAGEIVNKTKNGRFLNIDGSNNPITDESGQVIGFLAMHQDITERKQIETTNAKQAKDLQTVADLSTAVSTTLDTQQLLQEVVNRTKESFNLYHAHIYLLDETNNMLQLAAGAGAVGTHMVAAGHNIPYNHKYSLVAQAARSKQGIIVNNVFAEATFLPNPLLSDTKSEMAVPMLVSNKVIGVLDIQADKVGFFTDIDINIQTALATQIAGTVENARAYERAREQAAIIENTSSIIATVSMDQSLQYLNKAGLQRLGYSAINEVLGKHLSLLFPSDGAEEHRTPVMQAVQEDGFWQGESALITSSGERFPVDQTITLVRDENGIPKTLIFDMTDITERKQSEKSVLENQMLLRNIIDTLPDQIVVKSRANRFILVNKAFANKLGKPVDDIIGKDDIEIGYDEEQVRGNSEKGIVGYWPEDEIVMDTGQTISKENINEQTYSEKVTKTPLKDKDGHIIGLVVFFQDITTQKMAELEQRKLAQELEQQLTQVNALQSAMTREGWRAFMTTTADKRPFQGFEFNNAGIKTLTTEDLHSKNAAATGNRTAVEQVNPVKIQGTTIGKIGARNANGEPLTEKQRDLFASLTDQVAVALDRARLFEETELGRQEIEEQAIELSTVNEISELVSSQLNLNVLVNTVGDRLLKTFSATTAYIALVDEKTGVIDFPYFKHMTDGNIVINSRTLDEGGGFTGKIYRTRQPIIFNQSSASTVAHEGEKIGSDDSDSYIGVPMIVGDKVIGVIGLNSLQEMRIYEESDIPLLATLARTIGVALQNVLQFEDTQRRANREALVNEISQKIQNATTIENAMQTAVTELGKALGIQRAVIELNKSVTSE